MGSAAVQEFLAFSMSVVERSSSLISVETCNSWAKVFPRGLQEASHTSLVPIPQPKVKGGPVCPVMARDSGKIENKSEH